MRAEGLPLPVTDAIVPIFVLAVSSAKWMPYADAIPRMKFYFIV